MFGSLSHKCKTGGLLAGALLAGCQLRNVSCGLKHIFVSVVISPTRHAVHAGPTNPNDYYFPSEGPCLLDSGLRKQEEPCTPFLFDTQTDSAKEKHALSHRDNLEKPSRRHLEVSARVSATAGDSSSHTSEGDSKVFFKKRLRGTEGGTQANRENEGQGQSERPALPCACDWDSDTPPSPAAPRLTCTARAVQYPRRRAELTVALTDTRKTGQTDALTTS